MSSRLAESIAAAHKNKKLAFLPFLAGGYPDVPTFVATVKAVAGAGADAIEIGFPFSDPIADGPTIQAAFAQTLLKGVKVEHIFAAVVEARKTVKTPLVAMVSYSIVYRCPLGKFLSGAKASGFDAILIPDLPPPEAQNICHTINATGLDTVLLVAPTTSPKRRAEIGKLCTGFVYYLSVSGITGERDALPADLAANVNAMKALASVPVCVGFGISKPSHMKQVAAVADGAIVGSAIVKRMQQHAGESPTAIAKAVASYCREMTSGI